MKVGILSESPVDEAAIRILLAALLTRSPDQIEVIPARLRPGGWPSLPNALAVELRKLHYNTDAHALIAIADSDDSIVHEVWHDPSKVDSADKHPCRFCLLSELIRQTQSRLKARNVPYPLNVAVGLAVPALEAWLLCGRDPHSVEDRFIRELNQFGKIQTHRRKLKQQLYGTVSYATNQAIPIAIREATRLAANMSQLEKHFPRGFLTFAQQVRAW
jgi:hypothetical protein